MTGQSYLINVYIYLYNGSVCSEPVSTPDELLRTGTSTQPVLTVHLLYTCALLFNIPAQQMPFQLSDDSHLIFQITFKHHGDRSAPASGLRWLNALHKGTVFQCEGAPLPSRSQHGLDKSTEISGGQLTQVCVQADLLGPQVSRPR